MYQCERCGGQFAHFKTAGQCPLCGVWASVRCSACRYVASAQVFIDNNDRCPQCGAAVTVPGGGAGASGNVLETCFGCVMLVVIAAIIIGVASHELRLPRGGGKTSRGSTGQTGTKAAPGRPGALTDAVPRTSVADRLEPIPDQPTPAAGEIAHDGIVVSVERGGAFQMDSLRYTGSSGRTILFNTPKRKRVAVSSRTRFRVRGGTDPGLRATLLPVGTSVTVVGVDPGRGRPVRARLVLLPQAGRP